MKFTRLLFVAFLGIIGTINAQKEKVIPLDSTLQHPYEFSSLELKNDTLLLMSENCYKIFMIHKDSGELLKELTFNHTEELDVEAIRLYKNYLIFGDEVDNSLWTYNFKTNQIKKIVTLEQEYPQNMNHDFGIEGIAVNTEKKILYAVKEYGKRGKAELYCYHINEVTNGLALTYIDKASLHLKKGFRYADLTLSTDNEHLLLLRTKFNDYEIDVLDLNTGTFMPNKKKYDYDEFKTYDISQIINPYYEEGYSTNIEGLAADDTYVYLVSDNYSGRENNCENRGIEEKTLLVRLRLFY